GGSGEDEVKAAHPQGGSDICEARDNWGKVETIVEQHNINEGIATKNPTGKLAYVVKMLQKIATAVEEDGLEHKSAEAFQISEILDDAVNEIVSLAKKKKDDEDEDENEKEDKDEKKDKEDKDEDDKDEKKDKKKGKKDKEKVKKEKEKAKKDNGKGKKEDKKEEKKDKNEEEEEDKE
ncbi:unnamed protein product, partial [marine sediment metagenome]